MTPADVLVAAANLIDERGWWNGGKGYMGGTECAYTAICQAQTDTETGYSARQSLRTHIGSDDIVGWNDAQPDGATVIATLRQVAHELRRAE